MLPLTTEDLQPQAPRRLFLWHADFVDAHKMKHRPASMDEIVAMIRPSHRHHTASAHIIAVRFLADISDNRCSPVANSGDIA